MAQFAYRRDRHPDTDWPLIHLTTSETEAKARTCASFAPDLGSNLLSFRVGSTEYLYGMEQTEDGPKLLGTPILYPTPNRVRGARFIFNGRTFRFEPNDGPHFIHGLVRAQNWACDEPVVSKDSVAARSRIAFEPGTEVYSLFPIRNTLELTYTLEPNTIRFDFRVHNEDEHQRLPFGLAIHPYFRIIGPRESVRLQVPAQKWMEAIDLLPTGRLVDLEDGPADLRAPTSLRFLDLDDVFWGLQPDRPQIIYYDQIGKKVTLTASELFTHSVVYTPKERPFFCVENQSCSTDAHNLHAQGLKEEAHLTILEPGESLTAWIEIAVGDQ